MRTTLAALTAVLSLSLLAACGGGDETPTDAATSTTPETGDGPGGDGAVGAEEEPAAPAAEEMEPVDACALLDEADVTPVIGPNEERRDDTNNSTGYGSLGQCDIGSGESNVILTVFPAAHYDVAPFLISGDTVEVSVGDAATAVTTPAGTDDPDLSTVIFRSGAYAVTLSTFRGPGGLDELTKLAQRVEPLLPS